jgi:hypothetical protein
MLGEKLTASLPTNDGTATLHCTDKLTLQRETAELKMGAGAIMQAPQGRITANGPLTLTLAEGAPEKARPLLPQCPQLVYNFSGLKLAETEQGGTVQSKEAAMRCSGRIHVEMDDTPTTGKSKSALPVKTATAEGDVAVTGRDADGKILTASGDKLTIDGNTGEAMKFRNVIALYAKQSQPISGSARQFYELIGSGDGHFVCDGKIIPIQWHHASYEEPFQYTLEDGSPLFLGVGQTYIAVLGGDPISYE